MKLNFAFAVALGFAAAPVFAAPTNDFISGRELRGWIAGELQERLARSERLTLLPHNLSGVHLAPGRGPVFTLPADGLSAATNLAAALESYAEDHGGFRLVHGAEVLGLSAQEIVLSAVNPGRLPGNPECAIVGAAGVRRFTIPGKLEVTAAVRTLTDWGFRGKDGILVLTETNSFRALLPAPYKDATVFLEAGAFVFVADAIGHYGAPEEIGLARQTAGGIEEQRFQPHRSEMQTAIRLQDGRWLMIGEKIKPLLKEPPAPEETLAPALEAARNGDRAAFLKGLEGASFYTPEVLAGFRQLLEELPGHGRWMQELQWRTESLASAVRQAGAAGTNAVLKSAVAELEGSAATFLNELNDVGTGSLGIAPARVAELLRGGYQYFDGRWVSGPRVAGQRSVDAVELEMFFMTPSWEPRLGIFRLDAAGHLTLLADCGAEPKREAGDFPGGGGGYAVIPIVPPLLRRPIVCFQSADGQDLVLYPHFGLARLVGGKREWLDRSDEFKSISEVVGVDDEGRIYLRSGPRDERRRNSTGIPRREAENFWVYRLKGKPAPANLKQLIPVVCEPVMDRSNEVWFTVQRRTDGFAPAFKEIAENPVVERSVAALRRATNHWLAVADWPIVSTNRFTITADLYSYRDGQLFRRMTNLPPTTRLFAGPAGGIVGVAQTRGGAFLVDTQGAVAATNLHALAQLHFARLWQAAPERNPPPDIFVPRNTGIGVDGHVAVFRLGAFLLVAQEGKLEAYRDGTPLGLNERLAAVSPGNHAGLLIYAPLTVSNSPAALLYFTGYRMNHPRVLWAVAAETNIDLVAGEQPRSFYRESDYRRRHEIQVMTVNERPDYAERDAEGDNFTKWSRHVGPVLGGDGSIFFAKNADTTVEVRGPTGVQSREQSGLPVLRTRDGRLLAHREGPPYGSPYAGYRLCAGEQRRDVRVTFSRNLRVLRENADGTLLACSPEGLTWLKIGDDGELHPGREIRVGLGDLTYTCVGETATEVQLLVVDRAACAYLAVVSK
jgi:hypothetical protein